MVVKFLKLRLRASKASVPASKAEGASPLMTRSWKSCSILLTGLCQLKQSQLNSFKRCCRPYLLKQFMSDNLGAMFKTTTMDTVIIFILQFGKYGIRKVWYFFQEYTCNKRQSQTVNPGSLIPEFMLKPLNYLTFSHCGTQKVCFSI